MKRLDKIFLYFLTKNLLFSLIFGSLFYFLVSSADPTYKLFMGVSLFFIFIFSPFYLIQYAKEKNKKLVVENGYLIYKKGIIRKKEFSFPTNSIKIIQFNKNIIIDFFDLTKILITVEAPLNLSTNKGKININNSLNIIYITDTASAISFRELLNK